MLESLGLDRHVLEVYRSTLTHREWGIAEISAYLALEQDTVRRALDRLVELDLVRTSWERPGQWCPVDPDVGLSALVSRQRADLARRHDEIERAREQVAELVNEISDASRAPSVEVEHLSGADIIRGRLESLARQTRKESLSFIPGSRHSPKSFEASGPLDEAALTRGVHVRALYQVSAQHDPVTRRYVRWVAERGAESRMVPTLPLRLFIADRSVAILPLDPQESRAGAVAIRSPGIVLALCALFEAYWQAGTSFGAASSPGPRGEVTAHEQEILRQLASGAKDETIARALGVSLRTARRNVADLMARLEANSRFQAGVQAARRGWI